MASDGEGPDGRRRAVAIVTHRNLEGLQRLLPEVRRQAEELGAETIVVDNGAGPRTRAWLDAWEDEVTVLRPAVNEGPAGGYNTVLRARPAVLTYALLNDDLLLTGDELRTLVGSLEANPGLGLVCGVPAGEEGTPLTHSFARRPLGEALRPLWSRWWGEGRTWADDDLMEAEAVSGSNMVLRGRAARQVGEFDTSFWPVGFDDLDYAARLRFRGWGVAVHRAVRVPESVSATTSRVFGPRYDELRRSSGLLYAAMDYPLAIAGARIGEAILRALTASHPSVRRGDGQGLLRCCRQLAHILAGRRHRAHLRQLRSRAPLVRG